MIGIVIVAHGGLAQEYLAAMQHVVGPQSGSVAISIGAEDDRGDKQAEIARAIEGVDQGDGVVVVTDIFGGTPSNLAMNACESANRKVLYGANLPMLIKLAKARHLSVQKAVDCAVAAGRKYIRCSDDVNMPERAATP